MNADEAFSSLQHDDFTRLGLQPSWDVEGALGRSD